MKESNKVLLLVASLAAMQIVGAASAPLLSAEGYYWLWGRYPAGGYFDHPPMVAFVARLFFGWIDGSPLAARSSSLVLSALTLLIVYRLGRLLYPEGNTGWHAALIFAFTPIFHVGGAMLQPDNSLLFFMALTWLLFWKASREEAGALPWILAGVTAGCALLAKFHAWVLLPPLYLFLLLTPSGRRRLKSPWPWLAIVIAILVLSPNLVWNANRGWLNYAYQWRRSDLPESEFDIENILIFALGPLISLSPLVYALLLGGIWKGFREWLGKADERALFLICAGLPLPAFLGLLSFVVTINLHWPSAGYIPLLILGVALVEQGVLLGPRFLKWTALTAFAICLLSHLAVQAVNLIPPEIFSPIRGDMINTTRLKAEWNGWPEIGREARRLLDEANKDRPTVLMTRDHHLAASIAFYSERPRETFAYRKIDAHSFGVWFEERGGLKGVDAIVFIQKSDPNEQHTRPAKKFDKYLRELEPLFESVRPMSSLIIYTDGSAERYWGVDVSRPRYREMLIFHGRAFKGELLAD